VLPAFIIGLREGLETVVIIGAITVFLRVRQRTDLLKRVWRASALAVAICIAIAFIIRLVEVNLPWRQQEQLETVVGLIAVVMVTYMIVWMRRFPKDLQHDANSAAASALESDTGRALVVLAFLAVLREGFEIAVFVIATIGMTGDSAWLATWGAVLGVLVALGVGAAIVRGSTHIDVARFFRLTALVLVVTAAGIAMATVHTANAAGWITFGQTPQYDLAWLAPPGSVLSSFTTGMFGLQPYPVLIEVITWVAYLVPMLAVVLWPARGEVAPAIPSAELDAANAQSPAPAAAARRRRRDWLAGSTAICVALAATGLALANHHSTPPAHATRAISPQKKILYATLNGVTCSSATRCVAVGEYLPVDKDAASGDPDGDGRASHTLVESSDGDHWQVASSPDEGQGGAVLSGISCPTSNRCVAVGYYRPAKFPLQATSAPPNYPLIETDSGGLWEIAPSPRVAPNSILVSVSCPSATRCVAVGYTTSSSGSQNTEESLFAESLDGNIWRVMPTPSPPDTSSGLSSVSCSSAARCVAVGNVAPHDDPSATTPLIETFDGAGWSLAPLPAAVDGPGILYAVTCTSEQCTAVGSTEAHRATGAALVLSSTGTAWSPDQSAMDQTGDISLTAVACVDAAGCVVAGTSLASLDASPEKILARVTTSTWQELDVVAKSTTIDAISCGSAEGCRLVGSATRNSFGNTTAAVAALSGNDWTTEATPTP
jgi:high-affinity iron transporter